MIDVQKHKEALLKMRLAPSQAPLCKDFDADCFDMSDEQITACKNYDDCGRCIHL